MDCESTPKWTNWWQYDIPCHFSPTEAARNAAFLTELLGSSFLNGAYHPIAVVKHPILQRWKTCGAGAFLELNALASDLKVVMDADGFDIVLHDLKKRRTCLSTWHTVHAAALLGRGSGSKVARFFPQTEESTPDFLILYNGEWVMCEAKLLTKSAEAVRFEAYASGLSQRIMAEVLADELIHPSATVVLKKVDRLPSLDDVVRIVAKMRKEYSGSSLQYRSCVFNVFLNPPHFTTFGARASRSCFLLCPRSEKEDLRVHRIGARASKQLKSKTAVDHPGLLLLGITNLQDPGCVVNLFRRRFQGGEYPGVSGVILIHAGTHMERPLRAPLDLITSARNHQAKLPHPNLALQPVGLIGQLPDESIEEIPAYRHLVHEVSLADGLAGAFIPDVRTLNPLMLADEASVP